MKTLSCIFSIAIAGTLFAACGEPAGRTGSGTDPVSLTAYEAGPTELLGQLAADTAESAVTVEAASTRPAANSDEDGATLAALAAGDVDLALLRSGRLAKEGAESLAPLGAPFLVTNNDQAIAIARDEVTEDLFADLPTIGLVGLGMMPTGVRHPFGYSEPLLGAEDYAGQTINVRVDGGVEAILDALGARPDTSVEEERSEKVASGELRGIEAAFQIFGAIDRPAVVASNVTLYERFDVVVIRKAAWDGLTSAQQKQLREAVASARDQAYGAMGGEEEMFGAWCLEQGAGATLASADQLQSLHLKLDPITARLEQQYDDVVGRMRSLHDGTTDAGDLTCPESDDEGRPAWAQMKPEGDQHVLDGTWRFNVVEAEMLAAGVSASDAHGNAGIWEMSVDGGIAEATVPDGHHCDWTFVFAGDQVVFDLGPQNWCQGYMGGTYRITGDTVHFNWTDTGWPATDADYGRTFSNAMFGEAVRVQG